MADPGGVPEWPKGTGCKPVGSAYGGSNPPAPTSLGVTQRHGCCVTPRLSEKLASAPKNQKRRISMEAVSAGEPRRFDHLREHSIGLWQVLFQSITHMAPAAAVAYS